MHLYFFVLLLNLVTILYFKIRIMLTHLKLSQGSLIMHNELDAMKARKRTCRFAFILENFDKKFKIYMIC